MGSPTRLLLILVAALAISFAQTTTGTISGSVTDAQGAAIVGASVAATNMDTSARVSAKTDGTGGFVFVNLLPARYEIRVEQPGFKSYQQRNIVLPANSSISIPPVVLQIGQLSERIEVTAQGAQLQTESAEQGTSVVGKQIENIQVNGRSFLALLRVVPGVITDGDFSTASNQTGNIYANGSRGNQFNQTLNGAGNLDTGSGTKMMATVSTEAIQEFRTITSSYDAQYGKAGGAQVSAVTKSGSAQFHGLGYWYFRDKGLNANNWINNRDGLPRSAYHYNYIGYQIGGPAYIPNKFNRDKTKLFFFWSDEYQRQLVPQGVSRVTVPTQLERAGDFSQSHDSGGKLVTIKDWTTGLPFSGNAIPAGQQYKPGMAALNIYPLPNVTGQNSYNYQSQVSASNPRHEQLLRLDYNATDKWRFTGSWVHLAQDVLNSSYCPSGYSLCSNIPLTPFAYDHPGYILALNATTTISPTMVNEAMFDINHHPVSVLPVQADAYTRTKTGISLPTLYSPYQDWIPNMIFGGTKIANSPSFNVGGGAWTPFSTYNSVLEWVDNFSKIQGQHLFRAGVFIQRSRKNQSAFAPTGGLYNFGDTASNPYDTGFGFANAAYGVYSTFQQANQYLMGQYRYTNAEFYGQDTWKVTRRATVTYGVRGYWIQPTYDQGLNTSNFLNYDPSKAVRLYWPALDASGNKVGLDRATGQTVPSLLIGMVVPNSGNYANGLVQAGQGVSKYLMKSPGILWAPRLGIAYDLTGKGNVVFRAGGGVYYDRYQGNEIFNLITSPPVILQPTVYNGLAKDISLNNAYLSPTSITAIDYNGKIPTIINYSAGFQVRLPWALVLDASYAGGTSRHLLENININSVPYGGTFLAQNQDPVKVKANPNAVLGSNAYDTNFLRPFSGYSDITFEGFAATSNYNALLVKLDRRFATGVFLSTAFTWSKCLNTADNDGSAFRIDNLSRFALYGPCGYNVPFNLTFNYVYEIPGPKRWGSLNNVVTRALFDGWQISGLTQYRNGFPVFPGFGVPGYGNAQLTGSNQQGARVWLVGNPLAGTTSSPYNRLNPAAFLPPQVGSIGIESPRNYIVGPGVTQWDMSLEKNIRITEKAKLQLRLNAQNVFNQTQFSGLNATINFSSLTNPTVTNLPINPTTGALNKGGFGTVSGARTPRILEICARIVF